MKMESLEPCELCGKSSKLTDCLIEGTLLSVCKDCSKFGNAIETTKKVEIKRKIKIMEETELISKNYPSIIKNARERLNFKQKELAEKIGEKESVIHQLESGQLDPSMILAKKLENFFKIKLIEKYEEPSKKIDFSDANLTIGDLLKVKKRRT